MTEVLEGALNAKVLGGGLVEIKLPMELVSGSERVGKGGALVGKEEAGTLPFLLERQDGIREVLRELKTILKASRGGS